MTAWVSDTAMLSARSIASPAGRPDVSISATSSSELEMALMKDEERVWGDRWWGGIEGVTKPTPVPHPQTRPIPISADPTDGTLEFDNGDVDEDESAPPEFDLRTGKLVSHSRPMRAFSRNERNDASAHREIYQADHNI